MQQMGLEPMCNISTGYKLPSSLCYVHVWAFDYYDKMNVMEISLNEV